MVSETNRLSFETNSLLLKNSFKKNHNLKKKSSLNDIISCHNDAKYKYKIIKFYPLYRMISKLCQVLGSIVE